MSEGETLYLLLLVFYLIECGTFTPRGAIAFHSAFGGKCRQAGVLPIFEGRPGVLRFANPLPPLGRIFVASAPMLSYAPDGLVAFSPAWPTSPPRRDQTGNVYSWEEIGEVATIDREVRIDGDLLLRADSGQQAAKIAGNIATVKAAGPQKREAAIERILEGGTDAASARERVARWKEQGADLRFLANVTFLLLFLGVPLAAHLYGVERIWLPGLAALLALTVVAIFTFRGAHRKLYPEEGGARVKHLLHAIFTPCLIRAPDALSEPLLTGYHPLAAAAALMNKDAFREFAGNVLRDRAHPLPPAAPERGAKIVAWHRKRLDRELRRLVTAEGLDFDELLRIPEAPPAGAQSCCPRCLAEYTLDEGECSDCAIPLVALRRP